MGRAPLIRLIAGLACYCGATALKPLLQAVDADAEQLGLDLAEHRERLGH